MDRTEAIQEETALVFAPFPTDPRFKNVTGQRYGKLVVLGFAGQASNGKAQWWARCDCGKITKPRTNGLSSGTSRSCGCLRRNPRKHGNATGLARGSKLPPEYVAWICLKQRCCNPNDNGYCYYGALGISVSPLWLDDFARFLADVGPRPSPKHSIDRYPNNAGNYEPGNVRWATATQQSRNRKSNRLVSFQGKAMPLADVADIHGVKYMRLYYLLSRMSLKEALERC